MIKKKNRIIAISTGLLVGLGVLFAAIGCNLTAGAILISTGIFIYALDTILSKYI